MLSHESPEHPVFHNTWHLSDGNHRHPCLNTGSVFQCIFFFLYDKTIRIFLLGLLWELIKAHWTQFDFWHNFDTLLTNDQLFAICLRLQRISDSEFWTVCLGFYPRSHWDHIVQSVKQQSWKTEKNQTVDTRLKPAWTPSRRLAAGCCECLFHPL